MQQTIALIRESALPLYDKREVSAITSLILEDVCGVSRVESLMHPDKILPEEVRQKVEAIAARLATGEPVQYILGHEVFLGKEFLVNPSVLIPRPETAELVQLIVESVDASRQSQKETQRIDILDVGTGSGCIGVSLARLIENSFVVGADISTEALITARRNAEFQQVANFEGIVMDILNVEPESYQHPVVDKFDVIVSNPPYVLEKEKQSMEKNVLDFEPHTALFVPDDDPHIFYRAIAKFAARKLKPGGLLAFEVNAAYGPLTCELLAHLRFKNIILKKDINGLDRMITAKL